MGVVLSGCVIYNATEVHEPVLTLLAQSIAKAAAGIDKLMARVMDLTE